MNHRDRETSLKDQVNRLEREIDRIAEIQTSLLPDYLPAITGLVLAASHRAQGKAGGDYYDFIPLQRDKDGNGRPNGRWAVIVADASGHGPSAAVIMAMLQSILHAFSGSPDHPAQLIEYANDHLCEKELEGIFATAIVVIIDPARRALAYACAGHEPPLVHRADGSVARLDAAGGLPLGVKPGQKYDSRTVSLSPGETMLLYTDGLTDAMDPGGHRFGLDRVRATLQASAPWSAANIVSAVNRAVARHRQSEDQVDDETLVAITAVKTGTGGRHDDR